MSNRGGYSGSTIFEYKIERFRNKRTGELLTKDDLKSYGNNIFEFDPVTFYVNVDGNAYYHPGRYRSFPEDCEPDESNVEIESVMDENGKDWEPFLTKSERKYILESIIDRVSSNDDYDPDDYNDYVDPRADYVYDPYHD
jgi:hypothetical protein